MFIFANKTVQRAPWNKGKLTGQKPPLLPKHVWAIRTKLHLDGRIRDLALFNLAIDSNLRGCDLVSLKAGDVAPHGYAIDRAMVRQRKQVVRLNSRLLSTHDRLLIITLELILGHSKIESTVRYLGIEVDDA